MRHLRLPAMALVGLVTFVQVGLLGLASWSWATITDDPPPDGPGCLSQVEGSSGPPEPGRERVDRSWAPSRVCAIGHPEGSTLEYTPEGGLDDRWGWEYALAVVVLAVPCACASAEGVGRLPWSSAQVRGVTSPT